MLQFIPAGPRGVLFFVDNDKKMHSEKKFQFSLSEKTNLFKRQIKTPSHPQFDPLQCIY